jgi:hypothetical protein
MCSQADDPTTYDRVTPQPPAIHEVSGGRDAVDEAWAALEGEIRDGSGLRAYAASVIAHHRPLIEAAIKAEASR